MRKRQNLHDPDFVKKRLILGYGSGKEGNYLPWLTVHDLHPRGIRYRVFWSRTGRIHHLFGTLTYQAFLAFATDPSVTDIRETYPLIDFDRIQTGNPVALTEFAQRLASTGGKIITTDLLITHTAGARNWDQPYSVSYQSNLGSPTFKHRHGLCERYWKPKGAEVDILTENQLTPERLWVTEWLFQADAGDFLVDIPMDSRLEIAGQLARKCSEEHDCLAEVAGLIDEKNSLEPGTSLDVSRWMLYTQRWRTKSDVLPRPDSPLQLEI